MSEKKLFVFAGPNGSGKSTIIKNAIEHGECTPVFISPDDFVHPDDKNNETAVRAAQTQADIVRQHHLGIGKSFTFETVLSIEAKLDFIKQAKHLGYFVHVIYVTTSDPQINLQRIALRVSQGGHDVPAEKVIARYKRSMDLMFDVIREADRADIYDNSGKEPEFVAAKIKKIYYFLENPPEWLDRYFVSKVKTAKVFYCAFKP